MRPISLLIIILLPPSIILGNLFFLVFDKAFYLKIYEQTGAYNHFEEKETILETTNNLISYFRGKSELDHIFFSQQAIYHLSDVKRLLEISQVAANISI